VAESETEQPEFELLMEYLRENRGQDYSGYKRPTLERRVQARMRMVGVKSYEIYVDYLEVHPEEFEHLFNTILINVTSFFRDPAAWTYLAQEIIPQIVAGATNRPVRIWSAGCASGEEAFTLAMVLAEAIGFEAFRERVKIYATDVDEEALSAARKGSYSGKEMESVADDLKEKYFEPVNGRHVFRTDLRRAIIFGRHDLLQDAPISHLDLLLCRNTLMYFNAEAQTNLLTRLDYALRDKGFLFLGKAEMLLVRSNIFTPIHLKHRVFIKTKQENGRERLPAAAEAGDSGSADGQGLRLKETFAAGRSAQVLVDNAGNLALANRRAHALFGVTAQDIGRPFQDLEISYRPAELRSLIERVRAERQPIVLPDVEKHSKDGSVQYFDVEVMPLQAAGDELLGVSIVFNDVSRQRQLQQEIRGLKQEMEVAGEELQAANEELQSTNEELETTNEELQSTNEELETTNEELQSTNEELETMNEEMQSSNEELQTLNEELQQRTDEINRTSAFLESVFLGMRAAVIVVDPNFNVLVWNQRAEDLWGLREEEVRGQSLLGLDIGLPTGDLKHAIGSCISGEAPPPEIILQATNRRGKTIKCRVGCAPLIAPNKKRQGAILLMEEVEK
jgi:two-component system CheB/CheR fusion protein